MAGNSRYAGRSVTNKITAILLTFAHGNSHSLTEIARLAGLPLSTAYRLANELSAAGILERSTNGQYRAGLQLKLIGTSASPCPDIYDRARRVMEDLTSVTRATARFGILRGSEVAALERRGTGAPVSAIFEPKVRPLHATAMGKALLAFAPPAVLDEVVTGGLPAYTPFTLTSPHRLRRALTAIRLTRVATSRRELDLDTAAVAVPVFGPGGNVIAALELEMPDASGDATVLQAPLMVAARALSRELVMLQVWRQFASNGAVRARALRPVADLA